MFLLAKGLMLTRGGLIAMAIMAGLSWRAYDVHHQRQIGASRVVAKIEKGNNANAEKAHAARRSVDSVPADSLFDNYRRD